MRGQGRRRGTRRVLGTLLLGACALVAPAAAQAASITVNDIGVTEANGNVAATFSVTRSPALLDLPTSVSYRTVDATAVAPGDYTPVAGSLAFDLQLLTPQTKTVTVIVKGDALDEPTEGFKLVIAGAEVTDGEGIALIGDDDPAPVVSVADAVPAPEGGNAVFVVSLSAVSGQHVAVSFATADGSAVAPGDYTSRGNTITIAAGSTSAPVGVPLVDDAADEPDETFGLQIGGPVHATLGRASATATIVDNDAPAVLTPPPASPATGSPVQPSLPAVGSATPGSATGGSSSAVPLFGLSSPRLRRPDTIVVTLSCPQQAQTCSGRVTIFSRANRRSKIAQLRRERRLGRKTFKIAGGRSQTLALKLGRTDLRLLNRSGRMNVRAYAVTDDAAGRTGVRSVNGTLIARTTHSSPVG